MYEFALLGLGFVLGALAVVGLWSAGRGARLAQIQEARDEGYRFGLALGKEQAANHFLLENRSIKEAIGTLTAIAKVIRFETAAIQDLIRGSLETIGDQMDDHGDKLHELLTRSRASLNQIREVDKKTQAIRTLFAFMVSAIANSAEEKKATKESKKVLQGS